MSAGIIWAWAYAPAAVVSWESLGILGSLGDGSIWLEDPGKNLMIFDPMFVVDEHPYIIIYQHINIEIMEEPEESFERIQFAVSPWYHGFDS